MKTYRKHMIFMIVCILVILSFYEIKGNLYILFRNIPKTIVHQRIKDYDSLSTQHFIIRHKTEEQELLKLVEYASEEYYNDICQDFNYYPKTKPTIIFYDNSEELLKNANLGESRPPMGVYYASTIQVLTPKLWNIPQENIEDKFLNEGPMIHEFTHLLIDDITKGNYPLWFTEGVALYQEFDKTGYEWGKEIDFKKIYSINELNNNFNKLDQYLAYTQSYRVVKYIVDRYGFEIINEILLELERGSDFNKSFEKVTGDKIDSLNI